jgi:hypothetical protein
LKIAFDVGTEAQAKLLYRLTKSRDFGSLMLPTQRFDDPQVPSKEHNPLNERRNNTAGITLSNILDSENLGIFDIKTKSPGPQGRVPVTEDMLRNSPSGNLFAYSQNAGMGWNPDQLSGKQFLILSTQGGIRKADGTPVALGYHTGHWEVGLLMQAAAEELKMRNCLPFAAFCTDPCDGRTQGTTGTPGT